ncbi:MAG: tRNA (N6-isopentenyl adenosine(37)-C2)-methylthiotransferase MiaB [Deltaproteobacteria bacterium]|nr:tRNA (N6-isopentenyl adenosine(37)-C2)-methylthiotransferase MiaB [Deltaproteobacteria bacterium]
MKHFDQSGAPGFYLETYGCQMNVADSQVVAGVLSRAGCRRVERPQDADFVLLNTCAIRERAETRVLARLSELAGLKSRRPGLKLGLLGCMAQHNRGRLVEKAPYLDLVVGPDGYRRLPELLGHDGFDPAVEVRLNRLETYEDIEPVPEDRVRAYVTVMRGCDRFCAFCVVPYVRGRERSLAPQSVTNEVRRLAARGVKEVILLGQTVNAYRYGTTDFAALLRAVAAVDGIARIRFTSPHPLEMTERLIEVMATEPKVQPYLHLPVQSGSNRVLEMMGRGHTAEQYLDLVGRLRRAVAGLALSTDIIVGFHGEAEQDFAATLALLRAVRFDAAFTFKYSRREHTRAFGWGDTVPEDEKSARLAEVIALQEVIALERNRELVGSAVPVLVEGQARRGGALLTGKTPQFKTAVFAPLMPVAAGDTIAARVCSATSHTLICDQLVGEPGRQGLASAS